MNYKISFSLQELVERLKKVRNRYTNNNPDRIQLINILDAVLSSLEILDKKPNDDELRGIVFAAGLFCLESIDEEYKRLSPERSSLRTILFEELGCKEAGKPDYFDTLECLGKFFSYFFKNKNLFKAQFEEKKLDIDQVETQVKNNIQAVFNHVSANAKNMLKVIPSEKFIDQKLATLPDDYETREKNKNKTSNPERLYLAQLGKALSEVIPVNYNDEDKNHFLSRSQRAKMGALLAFLRPIKKSYWRSPRNSELYDLGCLLLNVDDIDDIDPKTQLACLATYRTLINDRKIVGKLENSMRTQKNPTITDYLDPKLCQNIINVDQMIKELSTVNNFTFNVSPMTIGLAVTCGVLSSLPGFGVGKAIGEAASMTGVVIDHKLQVSNYTGSAMVLMMGDAGKYLAYYGADKVVNATLEHAFAKVFETLTMLAGVAAGGTVGIVLFDLSYPTLACLVKLCLNLSKTVNSALAKNFDPRIVECLIHLPPDVFSDEDKEKLVSIAAIGMFSNQLKGLDKGESSKLFAKKKDNFTKVEPAQVRMIKSLTF